MGESAARASCSRPNFTARLPRCAQDLLYYQGREGDEAYGKPGECTEFTTALLAALDQCAAERSPRQDTWRVTTESIGKTIRQLLERHSLLPALFQSDGNARGGAIRTLACDPFVPFRLNCLPEETLAVARMQLIEGTGRVRPGGSS